ncbi:hypothetical protein GHT06_008808 [Daphnia sinensis]|uniref:PCI domain-containing protein n=1 Tax=Daphnia sinensis TaxID=1820382 RepID=A0AAD5LLS6_9CRUS|nr:hypothetical protein GHT06_008808 [Daphnia sinensis]
MSDTKPTSFNPLEQFVLLAKSAKGAAAVELIKQALESPGVYVFGELLDMPNISELEIGQFQPYYNLLKLFAFGTYQEYLKNIKSLPELTAFQQQKLRHLTIVTLSETNKCIPYDMLVQELEMKNLRELEDLVIEAIYGDVIRGKLDQRNARLEVDFAIGRDAQVNDIGRIIRTLNDWCEACDAILGAVETQVMNANCEKERHIKHRATIDEEVLNIKKTLKSQIQETDDISLASETRNETLGDKGKKLVKGKGLKTNAPNKFWNKS